MPTTIQTSVTPGLLACPECEAALETTQRYCVRCGARNQTADSPPARYFAAAAQRRRAPVAPARRRGVGIGTAALLAVLPLAIGIGVLVGRSGGDDGLAEALRKQRPTVVNVGGGGAGTAAAATDGDATRTTADAAAKDDKAEAAKRRKAKQVVATGVAGAAHSVVDHESTAASRDRDKAVVRRLNKQTGKSYVDSQRNLPDVIEVQKDPGAGPSTPQAPGQP